MKLVKQMKDGLFYAVYVNYKTISIKTYMMGRSVSYDDMYTVSTQAGYTFTIYRCPGWGDPSDYPRNTHLSPPNENRSQFCYELDENEIRNLLMEVI